MIQIKNLTKYYGKSRGIIELNLEVKEGECFGFIGPNGAGKSTTIRTLLGLISATSGKATIMGMDVWKDKTKILKDVGYLASEAVFYPGMKVKDVLKLSADLRKTDCTQECKKLCERLQLDVNRKVDELSFGNRKKVAIVAALQHNPKLLILDEPTSGLDPLMQKEFFEIIRERNKKGATVFLSSHILSEIQKNCTRAAIIREGKLIACDSVDALSKTNAKRITIHGWKDGKVPTDAWDVKNGDDVVSFLYGGDMKSLMKLLAEEDFTDISIGEPELEEIFLHYYE